jgi:hypothetical protein
VTATETPAFRPFTDRDWDRYPACNAPEIAETAWGTVVLDGAEVYVETHDGRVFAEGFAGRAAARLVAERILALTDAEEVAGHVSPFEVED